MEVADLYRQLLEHEQHQELHQTYNITLLILQAEGVMVVSVKVVTPAVVEAMVILADVATLAVEVAIKTTTIVTLCFKDKTKCITYMCQDLFLVFHAYDDITRVMYQKTMHKDVNKDYINNKHF
jgi:hypothetical protein